MFENENAWVSLLRSEKIQRKQSTTSSSGVSGSFSLSTHVSKRIPWSMTTSSCVHAICSSVLSARLHSPTASLAPSCRWRRAVAPKQRRLRWRGQAAGTMTRGRQRRFQNTDHVASAKKSGGNAPGGNADAPARLIQMGLAADLLGAGFGCVNAGGTPAAAQNLASHSARVRRKASRTASAFARGSAAVAIRNRRPGR